jgi:hypothetical protein
MGMIALRSGLVALLLFWATPSLALDPATASGHYVGDEGRIEFSHALALSQDNAEGLLDHGPQIRVLLSDKDVPVAALAGIAFPPVRAMARNGELRGLLLEFNPADRMTLSIGVLAKPDDPQQTLATLSLANTNGVWRRLDVSPTRIVGEYQPSENRDLAFSFSAPVFTDPVTADLKGAEAQKSEQMRVLIARAEALGRGDTAAALALSSHQAAAALSAVPPEMLKQAAPSMGDLVKELKAVTRVVVRRDSAVAIMSEGGWSSLVLEDGAWKVAD